MVERMIPEGFQMPPEMQKRLNDLKTQINTARISMEALKKIGMDVSMIEEKLQWAEETRKTLLSTFTTQKPEKE